MLCFSDTSDCLCVSTRNLTGEVNQSPESVCNLLNKVQPRLKSDWLHSDSFKKKWFNLLPPWILSMYFKPFVRFPCSVLLFLTGCENNLVRYCVSECMWFYFRQLFPSRPRQMSFLLSRQALICLENIYINKNRYMEQIQCSLLGANIWSSWIFLTGS